MKRAWLILFAIFGWALSAEAQVDPKPVRAVLAYGSEFRPAPDAAGNFSNRILTNYSLGLGYEKFIFIFEKATHKETSGNSTLNVTQKFENTLLWVQWRPTQASLFIPFLAGGVGGYQEKVETSLSGSTTENSSAMKWLGGAAVGVSLDVPVLWISVDARVIFGDQIEPQPALGGLAKIGVWF